jgi:hypothetical protein
MNESLRDWVIPEGMAHDMSSIGPTYPAHLIVAQAQLRLVADETSSATVATIKSDQDRMEAAQEIEAAAAKADSVNITT